jgi:GAF domain-containing protein
LRLNTTSGRKQTSGTVDAKEQWRIIDYKAKSMSRLLTKTASDLLDVIVNVAISAVSGVNGASVSVLIGNRPWFETTNATSAKVRTVDEAQYERAEGPCVEAILMGQEVNISVPTERWPQFNEAVLVGTRSVCSLPLIFAERTTGALNLYSTVGQPWGSNTARTARKLGGQAALVLANAVCPVRSVLTNQRGHQDLENRHAISQAKGMLMAHQAITADEALDILRRVSQHSGRKIRQIASDVVREFGQLEGQA